MNAHTLAGHVRDVLGEMTSTEQTFARRLLRELIEGPQVQRDLRFLEAEIEEAKEAIGRAEGLIEALRKGDK